MKNCSQCKDWKTGIVPNAGICQNKKYQEALKKEIIPTIATWECDYFEEKKDKWIEKNKKTIQKIKELRELVNKSKQEICLLEEKLLKGSLEGFKFTKTKSGYWRAYAYIDGKQYNVCISVAEKANEIIKNYKQERKIN